MKTFSLSAGLSTVFAPIDFPVAAFDQQ
jgi:hypothetical protein